MSDITMASEQQKIAFTYEELICEAFIKPIRNITVIDDEYPTLAQFLTYKLDGSDVPDKQVKPENLHRLQKIISLCHRDKNWGIDVLMEKVLSWELVMKSLLILIIVTWSF